MLVNMEHRGGCGCEPETGDGAGILLQIPHEFYAKECDKLGFNLPGFREYGVAMTFFPRDEKLRSIIKSRLEEYIKRLGFKLLGYRKVPTNNSMIGKTALSVEPQVEQVFLEFLESDNPKDLERRLVVLRKYAIRTIRSEMKGTDDSFYIASCSCKKVVRRAISRGGVTNADRSSGTGASSRSITSWREIRACSAKLIRFSRRFGCLIVSAFASKLSRSPKV